MTLSSSASSCGLGACSGSATYYRVLAMVLDMVFEMVLDTNERDATARYTRGPPNAVVPLQEAHTCGSR